jgi:hypothetical protein
MAAVLTRVTVLLKPAVSTIKTAAMIGPVLILEMKFAPVPGMMPTHVLFNAHTAALMVSVPFP